MQSEIHPQIQGDQAHVLMMQSPDHWPNVGPHIIVADARRIVLEGDLPKPAGALPLVRGQSVGVMTERPEHRWSVFLVLLFDERLFHYLADGDDRGMRREDYASAQEAFDAGWRVD